MIGCDFGRLDQADFGQDLGNRARADAHRRCQTALGLARLLESPLDHPDIQHGCYHFRISETKAIPIFRNKP